MDTALFKYISDRIKHDQMAEDQSQGVNTQSKPIITISRTFGCNAEEICKGLTDHFNKELKASGSEEEPWIYVNKTILNKVSEKMGVDPHFVNNASTPEERDIVQFLMMTFSKDYNTLDSKLNKALRKTTNSYLTRGNVILIGRGGVVFTKNNPTSLNVRISAPFEWRAQRISVTKDISYKEASKLVKEMDEKRDNLMKFLDPDFKSEYFDIGFNRKTMNTQFIVNSIITAFNEKVEDTSDKY
ncbi:cytidylate kinase-like family protein [Sediminitomix flava]|uniref:Cytidylate kinase n=1 Tax=Sediminitomix flava TaxID=379075 RepID=A0A315ZFI3_SEDFL|nr:cytidylate kinase-like family protein [Sediminitomix flava]PWJ43919.1 cytidylate kinase [Sediminitomix flava]